jgi:hypothetical protein
VGDHQRIPAVVCFNLFAKILWVCSGEMELSGNVIDDAFQEHRLHGSAMGADVVDCVARKSL